MAEDDDGRPPDQRPKSHVPQLRSASIEITRFQLLEYMKQRHWWVIAQGNLMFTLALWVTFMVQMWLRADVFYAYKVNSALTGYVHHLSAHPTLSGVPVREPVELPTPCRCSCSYTGESFPPSPCNDSGEVLDFLGDLPGQDKATLLTTACEDMPQPLFEFKAQLGVNDSTLDCDQWINGYVDDSYNNASRETMCSPQTFEAFIRTRAAIKMYENETLTQFFVQHGDWHSPSWRCPATCGSCAPSLNNDDPAMKLQDVTDEASAWLWVEHGLVPAIFASSPPGVLQRKNLIIGGLRARQRRAAQPFECKVPGDLLNLYMPRCRSTEPAESYPEEVDGGNLPLQGWRNPSLNANLSLDRTVAEGSDGAFVKRLDEASGEVFFDAHFEVEKPASLSRELATRLRRLHWLDAASRTLELDALMLNVEAGFFALLEIRFEFPYDGEVIKIVNIRTFPGISTDVMQNIPELVWLFLIVVLFIQEVVQIVQMAKDKRIMEYVCDLWNFVDWVSILLGAYATLQWQAIVGSSNEVKDALLQLPRAPLQPDLDLGKYREDWLATLAKGQDTYGLRTWYLFALFVYASVITARFLKGCLGQQKMAMIQYALVQAFWDVLHFMLIFAVIMANFVTGGHVLFGGELESWSSMPKAATTTLQMLMGTFQFNEMYPILPVSATVWFFLFLCSMVFLLLNLLAAIIIDHFHTFRSIVGPTDSAFYDIWTGLRNFAWRCEWRMEQIKDREFMESLANPYGDVMQGLAEKCKIGEEMELMSQKSCLGLRLAQARLDVKSISGLEEDCQENQDPRVQNTTSIELRKIGCDPMTAEHLMAECDDRLKEKKDLKAELEHKQVQQLRSFLKLLRTHRSHLVNYCDAIEEGCFEENSCLMKEVEALDQSVIDALGGLSELRETEIDTLAIPPPKLQYAGTSLRNQYPTKLAHQPPRKGTAPVPGRGGVKLGAGASLALGNGDPQLALGDQSPQNLQFALRNVAAAEDSRMQPALNDNPTSELALMGPSGAVPPPY